MGPTPSVLGHGLLEVSHPASLVLVACVLFMAATWVGYPAVMLLLAQVRARPLAPLQRSAWPRVSCVVAAHNEGKRLLNKVGDLLALDYPTEQLEVIIADDGSTDGAPACAKELAPDRVKVVSLPRRMGKPSVLTQAVTAARGEVLLLCDARQRFEPGVAKALVSMLADPRVGAATGQLLLDGARGPGAYWRLETLLRKAEGRTGSVVGVSGAIYAMRRELFPLDMPASVILDDVYIPMRLALDGWRVAYAEAARAFDQEMQVECEFGRKVRTLAGNYQLLWVLPQLLAPWRNPLFWRFLWHKVARLLCPWAILGSLVGALTAPGLLATVACVLQALVSALALSGMLRASRAGKLELLCYTFAALNLAVLVGLWRFVLGRVAVTWRKVESPHLSLGGAQADSREAEPAGSLR